MKHPWPKSTTWQVAEQRKTPLMWVTTTVCDAYSVGSVSFAMGTPTRAFELDSSTFKQSQLFCAFCFKGRPDKLYLSPWNSTDSKATRKVQPCGRGGATWRRLRGVSLQPEGWQERSSCQVPRELEKWATHRATKQAGGTAVATSACLGASKS